MAVTQVLIVLKWKNNNIHRHGARAGWFNKQAPICQFRRQKSIYIINTRMFLLLCERKSIWAPGWRASDKTQQAFTSTRRFPRSPGQFYSPGFTGTRYLLVISVACYTTRPMKALLFTNPGFGSVRFVTDQEKGFRFWVPVGCLCQNQYCIDNRSLHVNELVDVVCESLACANRGLNWEVNVHVFAKYRVWFTQYFVLNCLATWLFSSNLKKIQFFNFFTLAWFPLCRDCRLLLAQ